MKAVLILCAVLALRAVSASETFLLIDAMAVPNDAKQPTWIAIRGDIKQLHLPTGESIIAIDPGIYRLEHIDFQRYRGSGDGSVVAELGSEVFSFDVVPNAINHVGIIEMKLANGGKQGRDYVSALQPGPKLLAWACEKNPEPFSRLPVRYIDEDGEPKLIKVRCET